MPAEPAAVLTPPCCDMHGPWCPDDALILGACCDGCPDTPTDEETES